MVPIPLLDLGWTSSRAEAFEPLAAAGLVPGRVVLEHNHVFRVMTEAGEQLAESAGRMKHRAGGRAELPVVGDWVAVRQDPAGGRAQIAHVLPRMTWFSRKAAGRETQEQILAANIDTVFIVFGLDTAVKAAAIERYLVVARHSHATPVVVLNKADLTEDLDEDLAAAADAAGDVPVIAVSTKSGLGMAQIEAYLKPGLTVALLGPSGVGKSTIVNRLVGRDELATGEVREWDQRGRHTSVHRQMVVRDAGGLIIDTPGMRELQLWDTDAVADTFEDITAAAGDCRFRDCRHDREPGCAVKVAVEAGTIDQGRYASFLKLQTEQDEIEKKREARGLAEAKRLGRIGSKALKALQEQRRREGRDS